jgi:hypothetical protein
MYLWVSSPQPGCGKSRLLEVLDLIACNGQIVVIPTAPSVFRMLDAIEGGRLTLLLDELDKVYGHRYDRSELTGIIDQGNRRSGRVPRNVGTGLAMRVQLFPVFCPKALAGIEKYRDLLPETVRSRSIPIRMRKRGEDQIEWFFPEDLKEEAGELRGRLKTWAESAVEGLRAARPVLVMDGSLTDRQLEGWFPMFAIADLAGAEFGEKIRKAAAVLHSKDEDEETNLDLRLIEDGCKAFEKRNVDKLLTEQLIEALVADEDSPWRDMWGEWVSIRHNANRIKSIGKRIAKLLKPYGVVPKLLYFAEEPRGRGYERAQFEEAKRRWV